MNYNKMVSHKTIARIIACQPKFQEQLAKLTEQKQPNTNYIEVITRYDNLYKIKLKANSKEPAAKWGQPENQTRLKPKGNYGIITGKKNNLIVLDIDIKDDGLDVFNKYLLCHAKPETYTVQTPSGGFHYYFNYDSANEQDAWLIQRYLRTRTKYRGKGLDIRAAGGYVVGAGFSGKL